MKDRTPGRLFVVAVAVVIGAVVGATSVFWIQDRASGGRAEGSVPIETREPASSVEDRVPRSSSTTSGTSGVSELSTASALLAWTSGGLPEGFAAAARLVPGVDAVTEVRGDLVELTRSYDADGIVVDAPPDSFVIPLDAIAVERESYASFATKPVAATVLALEADQAVLSETSAELRRLGVGARIELADGHTLRVAAVVPDELVAAAELVVLSRADGPVTTPRYLLVSYSGDRAEIEDALVDALGESAPIRFRSAAESPVLRHGDAVLPQAYVKAQFGEFAYTRNPDGSLELDSQWTSEYLVTDRVPILGRVTCHRAVLPALRAALERLEADGLAWLVPSQDYGGCFAPRVATNGHSISRHTWGIAVDLNSGKFPLGYDEKQDPRLVDAMLEQGFVSGAQWLVPDPAHFEWVRPQR